MTSSLTSWHSQWLGARKSELGRSSVTRRLWWNTAIEVTGAENDFERAAAADQMWEAFPTAASGICTPTRLRDPVGVLTRRKTHIAGEDELTAHAPEAASDVGDADHQGLGATDERQRKIAASRTLIGISLTGRLLDADRLRNAHHIPPSR